MIVWGCVRSRGAKKMTRLVQAVDFTGRRYRCLPLLQPSTTTVDYSEPPATRGLRRNQGLYVAYRVIEARRQMGRQAQEQQSWASIYLHGIMVR